ncbi:galactokinase [Sediminibacterium ginsengisoli]|uniref:Galactokinase n=1 Tax=Sediminibacterium ginsengisoli TaxID=413434 RepID=A0A1T4KBK1_9BACT|nr:galactokinase [Sediminibacterium ginsengisoli]SJZ39766.1 galactokinase [Sediminibacterium ginsengisoli]
MKQQLEQRYRTLYNEEPLTVRSPGRINLIGEHTDYNMGFVMPAAIDKAIYIAIGKNNENKIRLFAEDLGESFAVDADQLTHTGNWPDYIMGVVSELHKAGHHTGGFNAVIGGDIPQGAGLSSSAALSCATAFALGQLFELPVSSVDIVKTAQAAENNFVGLQCGIMDQFASVFGKKDHLIKLDCRSLEYEYIPFELGDWQVLLFNSNVKHTLASSEYNTRRKECEAGIAIIREKYPEVNSLRDVTVEMLSEMLAGKNELVYRRCLFVVEEIARVKAAAGCLRNGDIDAFGIHMYNAHHGLSKLYEVSCKELDVLVDLVKGNPAVAGARMMGGGFGGCTINLVKKEAVESLVIQVSNAYTETFGIAPEVYRVQVEDGTSVC